MSKKEKKSYRSYQGKPFKSPKDHGPVKAKKFLGQHFLKDEGIAQKIGETLSLEGYRNVIEIGPGTGVLTKYLIEKDIHLVAMDLDSESIDYLNESFSLEHQKSKHPKGSFKVLEADFLKYDLKDLFGEEQFAIIGNFPYNISTQIVFKMLEYKEYIPEFSGMFQKEVAERICESNGSKAYGILSVLVQAFYDAEYLFTVPPHVFNPPPKVESGVLRLTRKFDLDLGVEEKLFKKVVKAAFNHRRKTLWNSLKIFNLSDVLKEDVIFGLRPEQLTVSDFITLTQKIQNDTV
ncbi:16S rRNA (adenine(1518)-N(6)/adenine(1519)-N(6))-dimethyltransferase RsmA [Arenibacter certesii]|uniref:Ribosomal RNA small subunit methyltransferase A n=1 Tax=Arenibacter certesii TaxID=228955 RepID=A0A918J4Q9_9FLAO|nr:16S rRNA (adenine(1518)-N(6)/adenine(1519)-N(6))-dimethyltransferase RsmA [Arenibacter certesii]GGW48079.1 ribosomal RNA small subunit methyltransferase A [Arenibacter certesii]